jgi:hypothetical protein
MFMSFRYAGYYAACAALIGLASARGAGAQTVDSAATPAAAAPPYALFQNATLTGTGNTFTATWLPVVTSAGTAYKNITIQFDVDSKGNLTIAPGYPQIAAAPAIIVTAFKAGTYVGPSTIYNGESRISVSGPGVTSGGATEWSLAAATGAYSYTYPETATWYDGPISSNPLAARLKAAGITSTAWSYGVGGGSNGDIYWSTDSLLGFSQIGNTLTIVSFTNNGVDKSEPVDTITYTLQ